MQIKLAWQVGFGALALLSAVPLWLTDYPPIQDLPQHLAAVRVLRSFHDPAFAFTPYFEIDLFRTQYLLYYLAAQLLAYPFGVVLGNKLLLTATIVATPYAAASLLDSLGQDRRFALLVLPLTYNAHLILGFFNFLLAVPLGLYGISLAVQQRKQPATGRAVLFAAVALLCFYAHVVPFAFLVLGCALVSISGNLKATLSRLLPLLPSALGAVVWTLKSPAGQSTLRAASGSGRGPRPIFQPAETALREVEPWLTDVLRTELDQRLLHTWALVVVLTLVVGLARPRPASPQPSAFAALDTALKRRLVLLPLAAAVLYFVAPVSYDWIWPIAQRFPLLAALFLVPVLPPPRRIAAHLLLAAAALISIAHFYQIGRAFHDFGHNEVGRIDEALGVIPPGQRVAGLIRDRGSRNVKFSPFIHYVAYYQVHRGGAVMFTFADFPASPFRFRHDNRPPRVPPRWEWKPERVDPARDLGWYDYVLVRGYAGRIDRQRGYYHPVFRSRRWSVWKRLQSNP